MICPTCEQAMDLIFDSNEVLWCPNCGTLKAKKVFTVTPRLVAVCRKLLLACLPPEKRPASPAEESQA